MTRIAFCGLGLMGTPMAARLIDAGHDVTVWNRTPRKAELMAARGAKPASSPAEATRDANVVITMLADPDALEEVVLGDDGVASGVSPGSVLIDMSTVGPETVRVVAGSLPPGVEMLDAPVRGGIPQATEGTLTIFVGGPRDVFERCRPILETLGTTTYLGPLGSGASMKLVANLALGAAVTTLAEALALGDVLNLREEAVLDMLAETPIARIVQGVRPRIETGDHRPAFRLSLAGKDLRLAVESAEQAGRDLRLARAAHDWFRAATADGFGDLNYTAVLRFIRAQG